MKSLRKKLAAMKEKCYDSFFAMIAEPCAHVLLKYRNTGSAALPQTTRTLRKVGVFPIKNHYYEPLFDDSLLTKPLSDDRTLPGIDLNPSGQLSFLRKLDHSSELAKMDLNERSSDPSSFYVNNGNFESGDADFLYQFIRAVKPNKIIEIGSGHSTKIARLALLQNLAETGKKTTHTCIEPYEMGWLEKLDEVSVIRKRVENCSLDWSTQLAAGDLLFVDSSHMIRPQGDVLMEYLEIFPLLASGVYIHIHDIFTPKDYKHSWVVDDVRFWNEQYLLEALLSNTDRYEVVGALNYLMHHNYEDLKKVCPYLTPEREPGSFYIRVR
jgi:Methyltransferase domain